MENKELVTESKIEGRNAVLGGIPFRKEHR